MVGRRRTRNIGKLASSTVEFEVGFVREVTRQLYVTDMLNLRGDCGFGTSVDDPHRLTCISLILGKFSLLSDYFIEFGSVAFKLKLD